MIKFGSKSAQPPPPTDPLSGQPLKTQSMLPSFNRAKPLRTPESPAADYIRDDVLKRIEPAVAVRMSQVELTARVNDMVAEIANARNLLLNQHEQRMLAASIVDDMIGLGPLGPLLRDDSVADILVNGPYMVYVERHGKLELTALQFRNNAHVMHVAQRIASSVGRRVDESSPMLDARLIDGSRVNVIAPPLCLNGPCVSIRKFSHSVIDFVKFVELGTVSQNLRKPAHRIWKSKVRSRSAIWCAMPCACGQTGSSSAKSVAPRPST